MPDFNFFFVFFFDFDRHSESVLSSSEEERDNDKYDDEVLSDSVESSLDSFLLLSSTNPIFEHFTH